MPLVFPDDLEEMLNNLQGPQLIAISGIGGSGKSTAATILKQRLNAAVVSVDEFQKAGAFDSHYEMWDIMDFDRLETEVLAPWKSGRTSTYGVTNPTTGEVTSTKQVNPNKTTIIEGVGLFRPKLMKYFDATIWIDCKVETGIARGKYRDRYVHRNPTDNLWDTMWKSNDQEYIKAYNPRKNANYILENN